MEKVFPYITQVVNQTEGFFLEFNDEHGLIHLPALPCGETRQVILWKVLEFGNKVMPARWTLNIVVRNEVSAGIKISLNELLNYARIVIIPAGRAADGSYLLRKEGIEEKKPIDHFFRIKWVPNCIRNKYWDKRRPSNVISGEETRLRVAEASQPQPELARYEGLQQIRPGRQSGPNDHQAQTRAYLRDNMPVVDDLTNITGSHVETLGSDGITRAAANPAARQETFRGSSSTEIAGRSNKDRVHGLGGTASQSIEELSMNELDLVKSENKDLRRRMGELEAKYAVFVLCMTMPQEAISNTLYGIDHDNSLSAFLPCHMHCQMTRRRNKGKEVIREDDQPRRYRFVDEDETEATKMPPDARLSLPTAPESLPGPSGTTEAGTSGSL